MKKIIIAIISLTMGTAFLRAQGLITFNSLVAGVQTNTSSYYAQDIGSYLSGQTFNYIIAPDAYNYIVLAATSTNAADLGNPFGPDWSAVTYEGGPLGLGTNGPAHGSVVGPNSASGFATDLTPDSLYYIMIVGWSSNLGDWDQVQVDLDNEFYDSPYGYFGVSNIGTITPASSAPPALVFGAAGIQPNDLVLYAVPEPTTLALTGLGGLLMLSIRRGKNQ